MIHCTNILLIWDFEDQSTVLEFQLDADDANHPKYRILIFYLDPMSYRIGVIIDIYTHNVYEFIGLQELNPLYWGREKNLKDKRYIFK